MRQWAVAVNDRTADLRGVTVLLTQPDAFLADYLRHALARAGAMVAGIEAAGACDPAVTVAAIDVSMAEAGVPADMPVVLMSSCPERAIPAAEPHRPVFRRPFAAFQLLEAIETLAAARGRSASVTPIRPVLNA